MNQAKKVKLILKDSYLKTIQNSIGAKTWRNLYAEVDGKRKDILRDGELSCAVFVSSVLLMFGLIKRRHATIRGTLKDMKESGWYEISKPRPGAVLLWEEQEFARGSRHKHLGFFFKNSKAISNCHWHRVPRTHHLTFGKKKNLPSRKIEKIFWHSRLNQ